jgi:hypothetical protein
MDAGLFDMFHDAGDKHRLPSHSASTSTSVARFRIVVDQDGDHRRRHPMASWT